MSKGLGRAGWMVGLTLGLALVESAEAQTVQGGQRAAAARPTRAPQQDSPNRLTEILVELAWLADPVTFPYFLEAHVEGQALELRGYVPAPAVREHAIKLARLHSQLPAIDRMREDPNVAVRAPSVPAKVVENAALTALAHAFPNPDHNFQVRCGTEGRVVVTGTVPSFHKKLAVSHALRRLHGCNSIANFVHVGLEEQPPSRVQTAAFDSLLPDLSPGVQQTAGVDERLVPIPVDDFSQTSSRSGFANASAMVRNDSTKPALTPPRQLPFSEATPTPAVSRVEPDWTPIPPPAASSLLPILERRSERPGQPSEREGGIRPAAFPAEVSATQRLTPIRAVPERPFSLSIGTPATRDVPPKKSADTPKAMPKVPTIPLAFPDKGVQQTGDGPLWPAAGLNPVKYSTGPSGNAPVVSYEVKQETAAAAAKLPTVVPTSALAAKKQEIQTVGAVTSSKPALEPAKVKTPTEKPASPSLTKPSKVGEPYVSRGLVFVTEPEYETRPAPTRPNAQTLRLKQAIEKACGSSARDVRVTFRSAQDLDVFLSARSGAEQRELASRIFALPELKSYRINLQINLPE
jgi:hypothetical protein